ncbi:MAG: hypothetical protein L3J34_07460 [Flavobacteriaceae bacterium]|nr:hypothetical protein [Flavobacteriaceae bacterium]
MRKKLMISCDEATAICDKNQYGEASKWDKLRLSFHLLLCKHCKSYSNQNNFITKLLGNYLKPCDSSKHLTIDEKNELNEKVKDNTSL